MIKAKSTNSSVESQGDLSWPLFLAISTAFLLPLWFVGYSVVYTEGEIVHGLFRGMTLLAGLLVLLGFHRRALAASWLVGVCGVLLIWQTWQIRNWVMIHEEIIGLVRHVNGIKQEKGAFPELIEGYSFNHPWVKSRVTNYRAEGSRFTLSYFMNDPGISYWYDSENGFGYYPD